MIVVYLWSLVTLEVEDQELRGVAGEGDQVVVSGSPLVTGRLQSWLTTCRPPEGRASRTPRLHSSR